MSSDRLKALQQENDVAGAEMLIESERFDRIKGVRPVAVSSFNLFQTPPEVAARMVAAVPDVYGYPYILEPSAGLGALYKAIYARYQDKAFYSLYDISPDCCKVLRKIRDVENTAVFECDFMEFKTLVKRDIIIMNPPFKNGTDVKHILHAREMIAPGGILVALCYNGVKQNKQLRPIADTWEVLPEGSFKSTGTGASVAMLTIRKGEE